MACLYTCTNCFSRAGQHVCVFFPLAGGRRDFLPLSQTWLPVILHLAPVTHSILRLRDRALVLGAVAIIYHAPTFCVVDLRDSERSHVRRGPEPTTSSQRANCQRGPWPSISRALHCEPNIDGFSIGAAPSTTWRVRSPCLSPNRRANRAARIESRFSQARELRAHTPSPSRGDPNSFSRTTIKKEVDGRFNSSPAWTTPPSSRVAPQVSGPSAERYTAARR